MEVFAISVILVPMKKFTCSIFILFIATFLYSNSFAKVADSTALKMKQDENLLVYKKALTYNDMPTAAMALVSYLTFGGDINYTDSLAVVYYNMNNFGGSYKIATDSYGRNNKNVGALTLLADISGQTNDAKTSLEWYEKLCPLNPIPFNYYQLATKQFSLERKMECRQSLSKVLADSAAAVKQTVNLQIGQGYNETVPVLAAAYNMLGVMAFKENNIADARKYYNAALRVFPEFAIAKQNIEAMNKPAGSPKKPAAGSKIK